MFNQLRGNTPSPAYPPPQPPQFVSAAPYPTPAPPALTPPREHSTLTFDEMIRKRYADSDSKVRHVISRSSFPARESKQQCLGFIGYLRIHKHLFMHTYLHLASCRAGAHLHRLVDYANRWKTWGSIQQLRYHSAIKDILLGFWADHPCHEHSLLFSQHFVISDDDNDFLCLLLYCGRKQELYELSKQDSEQVMELFWQFLMKSKDIEVLRRLRANIYRMARKSAYLPDALQIKYASISNGRELRGGAHGKVTKATMNGRDVVIKTMVSSDRAAQKKYLEMFSSEAILWASLQHNNIVPFLGVIAEGTLDMGLVSPFFKNGNIRVRLCRYNPEDWPAQARIWGRDIAKGLEYIHGHEPPIIHGDLKGDNVLVDDHEHACIGDFGQSHASDSGKYLDSTRVGLAYTPVHWMAPELMVGDRAKASDKSDMYSFGCVLYEMVSGRYPFEELAFGQVLASVSKGERPSRPESIHRDDRLWKVIMSCWDHRPEVRPSAAHVVSLLH